MFLKSDAHWSLCMLCINLERGWCRCCVHCRVEHIASSSTGPWPLVFDESTAVHVLQPDEVFIPPKQLSSSTTTVRPKVRKGLSSQSVCLLFRGHPSCSVFCQSFAPVVCSYATCDIALPMFSCYICMHSSASDGSCCISMTVMYVCLA